MRILTMCYRGVLMAAAITVAACADAADIASPQIAPAEISASMQPLGSGAPAKARVLRRARPLTEDIVDSVYVVPTRSGELRQSGSGLRLLVPEGAVLSPVWVKVIARAGQDVYYDFYPTPFAFQRPVMVEQDLVETAVGRDAAGASPLQGVWLPGGQRDVDALGMASIGELFPATVEQDAVTGRARLARFSTSHFSGYILAVGSTDTTFKK